MSLKALEVKAFLPAIRAYKKADELGLYLEVFPNGSKLWRFKYRFAGKEKRLALGAYPEVSLAEAREKRDAARKQMRDGSDTLTAHGLRTTASTLLNESGKFHPDAIERALSHKDTDKIRGTYRLATESRDALQGFLAGGEVTIHRQGRDAYGRTLARVTVDGRDAGQYLVKLGLARRWN